MAFPDTRHTLIQRLATADSEADWEVFLQDYWGPVRRFAARSGELRFEDAEDVAAATFEAIVRNRLLVRWSSHHTAKLRTLLCAVVRNVISNCVRVRAGRARLLREHAHDLDSRLVHRSFEPSDDQIDVFYLAWAEELAHVAVERLASDYHAAGRGDYFRVLYGRLCEGMKVKEIAESLEMRTSAVENYYKHARDHLSQKLRELVKQHVRRYTPSAEVDEEFDTEWGQMAAYLREHGGLDAAVQRAFGDMEVVDRTAEKRSSVRRTLNRMSEILKSSTNDRDERMPDRQA